MKKKKLKRKSRLGIEIRPWKGGRNVRICGVAFTPDEAAEVRKALGIPKMSVADLTLMGARLAVSVPSSKKTEGDNGNKNPEN